MKHTWVELQAIPIQADRIGDDIITSSTEDGLTLAEQESVELCIDCHTRLSHHTIDEECPGRDAPKDV